MDWQPIDTAPKVENSLILVWSASAGIEIGSYAPPDDDPESAETWCESGSTPTHWMRLPEPPEN